MASVNLKYWNECVHPDDLEALWKQPDVSAEWINVGETKGTNVHLSRDPDGQLYLTQTEMRGVAGIVVQRHFVSQIDSDMLCAIAALVSNREPFAITDHKKMEEIQMGIMQISPKTAKWLIKDLGYTAYPKVADDIDLLYKPFVNVYLGAAYLKWLSNFDQKERSEEFMVRAYKGGPKKATHKSTLPFWKKYLAVKESFPYRKTFGVAPAAPVTSSSSSAISVPSSQSQSKGRDPLNSTWDSRTAPQDMDEMWNHTYVYREWNRSGEKRGKVRFSHDADKKPYLSRVELKAVAEIILAKRLSSQKLKPSILCAIAEMVSMRFLNGAGQRTGIMGIDYPTACWLYKDGYKGYKPESVEDLTKPFVSMYFGAAYMTWLSKYEGRERELEFVVQAYLCGPKNVNLQQSGQIWSKFTEALGRYEEIEKKCASCTIL